MEFRNILCVIGNFQKLDFRLYYNPGGGFSMCHFFDTYSSYYKLYTTRLPVSRGVRIFFSYIAFIQFLYNFCIRVQPNPPSYHFFIVAVKRYQVCNVRANRIQTYRHIAMRQVADPPGGKSQRLEFFSHQIRTWISI